MPPTDLRVRPPSPAAIGMDLIEVRVRERLFGTRSAPPSIGRFTVIGPIGAGGMGVVFAAHDPELDRTVALKLVSVGPGGSTASAQTRLAAEARTMARLSHPNIVTIHEVGTYLEQIYLAMELVDGDTLERWAGGDPRPGWRAIVAAFVQAGHGLAAAHSAGVIHRDFKPNNAMIDRSGRVRVLDFGLATGIAGAEGSGREGGEGGSTAGLGGTPLYIAPEQRAGAPAEARTDQYAFCVALWTALHGRHPFERGELTATIAAMSAGDLGRSTGACPRWVDRVLARGLSRDAAERWPDMPSLVDALEHGSARVRRRRLGLAVGSVAGATALGFAAHAFDVHRRERACAASAEAFVADWSPGARAEIEAAILGTATAYAADSAARTLPILDGKAAALAELREEVCLDAQVRGRVTPELEARALWCLDERRMQLGAVVDALRETDRTSLRNAVSSALRIESAQPCVDEVHLRRLPPPPEDARAEIVPVQAELARVRALHSAGRYADAVVLARGAEARARAIDWPPLGVSATVTLAAAEERAGDATKAAALARDAYVRAGAIGAWDVAAEAATQSLTAADQQARFDEGKLWNALGELAEAHAGASAEPVAVRRHASLANLLADSGDLPGARLEAERVLALRERVDPTSPLIALDLSSLAELAVNASEFDEARALNDRARRILEDGFGPMHPALGVAYGVLGQIEYYAGDYRAAERAYATALRIFEGGLGPDHFYVGDTLISVATLANTTGDPERARGLFERALAIERAHFGPTHPAVAAALTGLAYCWHKEGRSELALPLLEQSLAIEEQLLGPDHINVAISLSSIGIMHAAMGEYERARDVEERAVAIATRALGAEHVQVVAMRRNLAEVYAEIGREAEALAIAEDAVRRLEHEPGEQEGEPGTHLLLARMLVATGGDRGRALAEARRALVGYRGTRDRAKQAEIEAWILSVGLTD